MHCTCREIVDSWKIPAGCKAARDTGCRVRHVRDGYHPRHTRILTSHGGGHRRPPHSNFSTALDTRTFSSFLRVPFVPFGLFSLNFRASRVGFAPPFHGQFTNGRVEGFLQARPLEPSHMSQRSPVDFVSLIAKELARFHRLKVTTVGVPGEAEMWHLLPKWLQLARGTSAALRTLHGVLVKRYNVTHIWLMTELASL